MDQNKNDSRPPVKLLPKLRYVLRLKHYSYQTEKNYVCWVKRFIYFNKMRHLKRHIPGRKRKVENPDFKQVHSELNSRKGVTLELLWIEWVEETGGGCSYSTFCRRYREWCQSSDVIFRNEYRGGELALCDYAGEGLSFVDSNGVRHAVEIFVSVLGASNYIFAEATPR